MAHIPLRAIVFDHEDLEDSHLAYWNPPSSPQPCHPEHAQPLLVPSTSLPCTWHFVPFELSSCCSHHSVKLTEALSHQRSADEPSIQPIIRKCLWTDWESALSHTTAPALPPLHHLSVSMTLSWSHYVAQACLKTAILLLLSSECWDYRHAPLFWCMNIFPTD